MCKMKETSVISSRMEWKVQGIVGGKKGVFIKTLHG